ncbi:MAG: hypothetical protein V1857_06125 [archaeon]
MSQSIRNIVARFVANSLSGPLTMAFGNLLVGFVRSVLKRIVKVVLGALLGVFGVAVLSIGLIKYLSWLLHMEWAAWVIVGLALALLGAIIFYSAVPRRK